MKLLSLVTLITLAVESSAQAPVESDATANTLVTPLTAATLVQGADAKAAAPDLNPAAWQPKPHSEHETFWTTSRLVTNTATGAIETNLHTYTQIGNGLNYKELQTGEFRKSAPEFIITADGNLESRGAGHSVVLKGNIAQASAITITSPGTNGAVLHSTPLGLSLNDGLQAIVIAQIKSSTPILAASNVAIYPDCFSGSAKADVRVVLTAAGVEVDIVLKEQLAIDSPADLNLNVDTTKMEVLTEAFNS